MVGSAEHLIYANSTSDKPVLVSFQKKVKIGDKIKINNVEHMVDSLENKARQGMVAPILKSRKLIVDNVQCSCYVARLPVWLVHFLSRFCCSCHWWSLV